MNGAARRGGCWATTANRSHCFPLSGRPAPADMLRLRHAVPKRSRGCISGLRGWPGTRCALAAGGERTGERGAPAEMPGCGSLWRASGWRPRLAARWLPRAWIAGRVRGGERAARVVPQFASDCLIADSVRACSERAGDPSAAERRPDAPVRGGDSAARLPLLHGPCRLAPRSRDPRAVPRRATRRRAGSRGRRAGAERHARRPPDRLPAWSGCCGFCGRSSGCRGRLRDRRAARLKRRRRRGQLEGTPNSFGVSPARMRGADPRYRDAGRAPAPSTPRRLAAGRSPKAVADAGLGRS